MKLNLYEFIAEYAKTGNIHSELKKFFSSKKVTLILPRLHGRTFFYKMIKEIEEEMKEVK